MSARRPVAIRATFQESSMYTRASEAISRGRRAALLLLFASLALPSCSERGAAAPDPEQKRATPVGIPAPPVAQALTIFAAASLRNAFEALAEDFRRAHPGVEITFNFAGSQELRTQIEHGAPADVFASADRLHLDALIAQKLAAPAALFARNHLVIAVPKGATAVKDLQALPRAQRIVIGGPDVPVGRYTRDMLARATAHWPGFEQDVMARVVSQELNVRQVLAKIALGEADAGIVYRTDAATSPDKVDIVPIPPDLDVTAEYPISVLAGSSPGAQAWVDHVLSPAGQQVLARFGFEPASGRSGGVTGAQVGSEVHPAAP
jgi:molybdate transport system substrate-binding protein